MKSILQFMLLCLASVALATDKPTLAGPPAFADGWRVTGVIRQGSKTEASVEHRLGWKRFVREGNEWSAGVVVERIDAKQLAVTLRRGEQTTVLHAGPGPDVARPLVGTSAQASIPDAAKLAATLIVPHVELHELGLKETIEFLRAKSRELDPDQKGVSILFEAPPDAKLPAITVNLRNIPLLDAARLVAQISGLELSADEDALRLQQKAGSKQP